MCVCVCVCVFLRLCGLCVCVGRRLYLWARVSSSTRSSPSWVKVHRSYTTFVLRRCRFEWNKEIISVSIILSSPRSPSPRDLTHTHTHTHTVPMFTFLPLDFNVSSNWPCSFTVYADTFALMQKHLKSQFPFLKKSRFVSVQVAVYFKKSFNIQCVRLSCSHTCGTSQFY